MTLEKQVYALRHSVALSRMNHMCRVRVAGEDAYDALNGLCTSELYVRDGQILHTLFLDESAVPVADIYVCRDDEDFILLAEGMSGAQLADHIRTHSAAFSDLAVENLDIDFQLVSLNGPFAWEMLAEIVGPEVVGLPYMSFFHFDDMLCFRAGKTGEYGYDLLVPVDRAEALEGHFSELGAAYDLGIAELAALDECALDNWFFNIRREGRSGLTPLELQLQWRVSYQKRFLGFESLARRRREGISHRLTCVIAQNALEIGDAVFFEDRDIGRLISAGYSHTRKDYVGLGLLESPYASSGIDHYCVIRGGQRHSLCTVSPPAVNNRSLYVNPQLHSYQTRHEFVFPDLSPDRVRPRE